jgi:formylglycine-generating enzyme required for sulfatase activity
MAKIFISYSRVDREFVEALAKLLREVYGYDNVWYDENLHGGDIWWQEILDAIDRCEIFIYLLSNESVTSPYCLAEFQEAQRLHKGIITVQVRDRTNLTGKLSDIHYIDMKNGVYDTASYNQLIKAISKQEKQGKPKRPSRKRRTPRPRIDITEPDEAPRRAEMVTPDLVVLPEDTLIPNKKQTKFLKHFVLMVLLVGLGGLVWFSLQQQAHDDLSVTPTRTLTSTPTLTATLSAEELDRVIELEMTQILVESLITEQAIETHMAYIRQTEGADSTLNALSWTPTPEAMVIRLTAGARLTATKLAETAVVLSYTPIPTETPLPTQSPIELASTPIAHNVDWTPIEQEFDGVTMVLVPAGCFMMGGTGNSTEQPIHEQCFDTPFWIDKYEVKQDDFSRLGGVKSKPMGYVGANRPVESILWAEARDFCQLRGGSLPTEVEWEYAARGVDGWLFPWGNDFTGSYVVHKNNSGDRPNDVGTRPAGASWVGAQDMSGNVWEWVLSEYRPYPYDGADGRNNALDAFRGRVLRGGSWNNTVTNLRLTKRFWNYGSNWDVSFGFRCVRYEQ